MIYEAPLMWLWISLAPFWHYQSWEPMVCRKTGERARQMSLLEVAVHCPLGQTVLQTREAGIACCTQRGAWTEPL